MTAHRAACGALGLAVGLCAAGLARGDRPAVKIAPELRAHQALKASAHEPLLHEIGLDTSRPAAERCALFVERRLATEELEALERAGLEFNRTLWVPPVPGRHPYGFHVATVPYANLDALAADPRFVRVASIERIARPNTNVARPLINIDDVHAGAGVTARDGTGVALAIADSGMDLTHPDLPTPVEAFDVTDGVNPATWGADVSNQAIDHGTHITGIAVGSGSLSVGNVGNAGGDYRGAAPGASLYFYKIGDDAAGNTTFEDQIEAIQRAQAVGCDLFSMSYGGYNSTFMDGSSTVCQAIDGAVAAGMSVFVSSGNEAHIDKHFSAYAPAGGSSEQFGYLIGNPSPDDPYVSQVLLKVIWRDDVPGDGNIVMTALNLGVGESLFPILSDTSARGTETREYLLGVNIPAGQAKLYDLRFDNGAGSGPSPLVHAYRWSGRGNFDTFGEPTGTLVHPGLCDGTITVGSWTHRTNWTDFQNTPRSYGAGAIGTLSNFSSRGPRVDGRLTLNLVAPGAQMIGTRDGTFSNFTGLIIDNDGMSLDGSGPANYYALRGTSQATPFAAGAAALIVEAEPGLTSSGVRNALIGTASQAGAPDVSVGYGLIDALAAIQGLPAPGTDADGDWHPGSGPSPTDCDDSDPDVWSAPGEVRSLRLVDHVTLTWSAPAEPGASTIRYDTLRTGDPADFDVAASCIESDDGGDQFAYDPATPLVGEEFYYLVRAVNDCPSGTGTIGFRSAGPERIGRACP